MQGKAGWGLILGLSAVVLLRSLGCTPTGEGEDGPGAEARRALLDAYWPTVLRPRLVAMQGALEGLGDALAAAEAARGGEGEAASNAAADEAFADAMLLWEEIETMQVGPLASGLEAVAGASLRDSVYSWPTTNACRVDQVTLAEGYSEADFFASSQVNVTGLDALEHLRFGGVVGACEPGIDAAFDAGWAALTEEEIAARRAAYGAVVVSGVEAVLGEVISAFDGGEFSLETPTFESDQAALNAVTDGMLYVYAVTKRRKLGEPLALGTCTADCERLVELGESALSADAIAANLRGARAVFTGEDGPGLDDLLVAVDQAALVEEVIAAFDAADASVAGLGAPVDEVLLSDSARVQAVYDAVKVVGELLKTEVATVLSLTVPAEAAGDAD